MTEPSEPLQIYADDYGGPDPETTARSRARVRAYARRHAGRSHPVLHRLQGAALVALLAAAGYGLWAAFSGSPGGAPEAVPSVVTQQRSQQLDLPSGGQVTVMPHSRVQLHEGPADDTVVELLEGELQVTVPPRERPWRFRVGAHVVDAVDAAFRIREKDGAPRVVVTRGEVTLAGPDLPDDGVQIAAPE